MAGQGDRERLRTGVWGQEGKDRLFKDEKTRKHGQVRKDREIKLDREAEKCRTGRDRLLWGGGGRGMYAGTA